MDEISLPALSPAEQSLMDRIWSVQPVKTAELLAQVNAEKDDPITRNTLQTQLSRLEAKGWIEREEGGRALRYRAKVEARRGRGTILVELKRRMFGGSTLSMMRSLVEEGGFSKAELADLKRLLDDAVGGDK